MVNSVMFTALKAEFSVIAVQDDDVHIPEINEVALEDLWPIKEQENTALNIEATANCIDMLRYNTFFSKVFDFHKARWIFLLNIYLLPNVKTWNSLLGIATP